MPEVYLVESCRLNLDRKIRSATGPEESVTFPEQDVLGRRAVLADALQDTAMIFAAKPLDVTQPEQVLRTLMVFAMLYCSCSHVDIGKNTAIPPLHKNLYIFMQLNIEHWLLFGVRIYNTT